MGTTRERRSVETNPYVFIVGCPRSGTTLLRRMIDAHRQIAITRETHWIAKRFERRQGVTPDGFVIPELLSRLLSYEKFTRMRIGQDELEGLVAGEEPVSYSNFVTGVFDLYGKGKGKRLVGDKTPAYVRHIPTLHALWPEAKFVHLIRDGRDVSLSATNWSRAYKLARRYSTWTEDPITTAALWWEWHVRLGREDGGSLAPKLYHEVRYEALVSEPAKECEKLCSFLDLPYDDAMLKFHEGRTKMKPGLDAKKAWLPITSGLRDWRTQMPAEDLERFEAAAGGLLEELGYPRVVPDPPQEKLEEATRIHHAFTQEVRAKEWRLPEHW
jgi:hypothetical protein